MSELIQPTINDMPDMVISIKKFLMRDNGFSTSVTTTKTQNFRSIEIFVDSDIIQKIPADIRASWAIVTSVYTYNRDKKEFEKYVKNDFKLPLTAFTHNDEHGSGNWQPPIGKQLMNHYGHAKYVFKLLRLDKAGNVEITSEEEIENIFCEYPPIMLSGMLR